MDFEQKTTSELLDMVKEDRAATPRELALLDRLIGAIDEISRLTDELAEYRLLGSDDGDT